MSWLVADPTTPFWPQRDRLPAGTCALRCVLR